MSLCGLRLQIRPDDIDGVCFHSVAAEIKTAVSRFVAYVFKDVKSILQIILDKLHQLFCSFLLCGLDFIQQLLRSFFLKLLCPVLQCFGAIVQLLRTVTEL